MSKFETFERQFAEILNVETLEPDHPLEAYAEWDSLSRLTVVALAQRLFGVAITSEDLTRISTVRDLEQLIQHRNRRCA